LDQLGSDIKEDELGRQGFSGRVAEFYRRNEPTAWTRLVGTLRPWDLDGYKLNPTDESDPRGYPLKLFHNQDVSIWISRRRRPMPICVRNLTGDEVYFVHQGTGVFDTEFGPIPYEPGDYVVLPKGTTYRVMPQEEKNYFLLIESIAEIGFGTIENLGRHAPFDPAILFIPEPDESKYDSPASGTEWEVRLKHGDEYSSVFYPFDPIDTIGWKGDLFAYKINIRDFRPLMSDRIHLMPSAHTMFSADGFVVCNYLPRPAEGDKEAERVPPFHRNVDCDEVTFTHAGTRQGAAVAGATFSMLPQGLHHGLPNSVAEAIRKNWQQHDYYDQKRIAVDTKRRLQITPEAQAAARELDQIIQASIDAPRA